MALFHLAFPVNNLDATKAFYVSGLGCELGRETAGSLILKFQQHQLVAHLSREVNDRPRSVYPRHFGLIFETQAEWEAILERAEAASLEFYETPKLRFEGEVTEHRTFFLIDPAQNVIEFKYYSQSEAIFGAHHYRHIGDRTSQFVEA